MIHRLAAAFVAVLLLLPPALPAAAAEAQPTLRLPLPGTGPVWADVYFHAGWRIQANVLDGRHRLLDAEGDIRADGDYEICREAFARFRQQLDLQPASPHAVVLLPGLGDHPAMFDDLAEQLREAGFAPIAFSYPSTRFRLAAHAARLATLLDRLEGYDRVSFVGYSLGGLVVRGLFDREADAWRQRLALGRLVMIASPNQGSAAAQASAYLGAFQQTVPELQDLQPANARRLPVPPMPFLLLAGARGDGRGYNPLLAGDDDGLVRLAETHLDGAAAHLTVPRLHAFVDDHPKSQAAILHFLKGGEPATEAQR